MANTDLHETLYFYRAIFHDLVSNGTRMPFFRN
ncbi:RAxF-45 family protein [Radiobacillus deserti]|nr:RAxF-45 family protein [Radiobacillus deserti]